jgi:hypothetical protein
MKKIAFFILLLIMFESSLAFSNAQAPQAGSTRKVLFEISGGERPVFNGSSLTLSPIGNSVTVFTNDDEGRFFVYENGDKRGPFYDAAASRVKLPEDDLQEFDPIFRRESDADFEKYIDYNPDGLATLKYGGKTFGPFQSILEFYANSDKKSFSGIVMKDGKPQLISPSGITIEIDGQPGFTHPSPTGNKLMVTTVKEKDNVAPEAYIYFQDGKKFGPYNPVKINPNNPAFSKTGGDNWLLTMNSKLFINGIKVKDLINEDISPANVWLTPDGKRFVIIVFNRLEFSDGTIIKDPLKFRISVLQNKITVWWLSVENEKDIVLYSKTI